MNPNPVTLSRRLSFLSLSLGLQLQSLCLSQSLRQPATSQPFSFSISHTSPSPSFSHLAVSSLDSKRRPTTGRPISLSISHTSPSPSVLHLAVSFFLPFRVSTAKDGSSLLQTLRKVHKNQAGNICGSSAIGGNQQLFIQRVWQQRPPCLKPIQGCCIQGDQSVAETVVNVLTSLPFIVLGIHSPRKNLSIKLYANSLIGVGVASSSYHSSRGKLRQYLRWADYTMIATTTVCLSRALRNENPKLLMAASALCLPFQPLMVSAVHTGIMEVAFAKRALKDPELRKAHTVHKMSSLLGGVLFFADDVFPQTPFLHAAWHLAAAIGVGTCNKLLE